MSDAIKETRSFEAEVKQLLHLMVHALYSNKEIFLRELISNASDAADKLRFEGISNPDLYEGSVDLKVWVDYDKKGRTITVRDNGIGMSKEEVIHNLGTIARSGTQEFLKSLTGDQAKDRRLIGQFGVGFYSSFIVSDKVTVNTRRAGYPAHEGVCWQSDGQGEYSLETLDKPSRGTEVILHLKSKEDEFLNGVRLRHIITKYSDHIALPIVMKAEAELTSSKSEDKKQEEPKTHSEEVVNRATALWTLPKSDIEDEQYNELYQYIAHDFENPLKWAHNKVEGKLEYTTLLYIPARAPFDLFNPNKARGLKLYVQRVFILDDVEQFLPIYLRFVRGIIDSNDLPLNISREMLQSSRVVDSIRSSVVKRILTMLEELASSEPEKYQQFWKEFGQVLKEGPAEDFGNKDKIATLLRFASTQDNNEKQTVSLEDYIARMKPGQEKIYYMAADTFQAARHSPHLEVFREKGIEVLLLSDRVDEWLMAHLTEFQGKSFQSVQRGSIERDKLESKSEDKPSEKAKEALETKARDFKATLEEMKKVLGDKVQDVRLSQRLTTSPSCIVADEGQLTPQMERMLRAAGQQINSKPILELNPDHVLVLHLKTEKGQKHFSDWSHILLDQAILSEGGQLEDPASFVRRFNELLLDVVK